MTLTLSLDKALHIIAGVVIYAVAHFAGPLVGLGAVAVAAVGKEVYDWFNKDKHTPDVWDAVATIVGGLLAWFEVSRNF